MVKLNIRPYQNEADYWRFRVFLRQVMLLNGLREFSWHVARLDYWWWFINADLENIDPTESIFFWETEKGKLTSVLNPEGRGQAFLHVHPDFATADLIEEMIALAEERLWTIGKDGIKKVRVYTDSQDKIQLEILHRRGFQRVEQPEVREFQHRRFLEETLPEIPATPGYRIRPLRDGLELLERCYASGLGFHEDDVNTARDNRDHPEWYNHIQTAPLYRRDLDLIAIASDGSIASFSTFWFDDVTRTAYIEPVATVPNHQRKGLGKAVILAGLHRLQRMGCQVAFVGGYSPAANALYFSVMGPQYDVSEPWEKIM